MRTHEVRYLVGVSTATLVSVGLLIVESIVDGNFIHSYLLWNLFLAWLPLLLSYRLQEVLIRKAWSSWEGLLLTVAWIAFLPNSFYMVSDFIHLAELSGDQLLWGAVVFSSFVFTSLLLGVASLYMVHKELLKRLYPRTAGTIVAGLLVLASAAIYAGRDLRWNSWDVILNPFGLLFDVSERVIHPGEYLQVLSVIVPFFVLLTMVYFVAWQLLAAARDTR